MTIGVFKFSSCDGCQLAFFEMEEEFFKLPSISYFLEAQSVNEYGHFDVSFVEGSVSSGEDEERIKDIRKRSKVLIAIGACAVSGGIQSVGNLEKLLNTRPIKDYVYVDHELVGCPISVHSLRDFFIALLSGKTLLLQDYPVCLECKRKGVVCLPVSRDETCLGPVTRGGCGAICPSYSRGCYGCYGPVSKPNIKAFLGAFPKGEEYIKLSCNAYNKVYRESLWRFE
ncbi:MAG: Ni/Fe hydrogenase subunit delta [Aquificaceae bacterium]